MSQPHSFVTRRATFGMVMALGLGGAVATSDRAAAHGRTRRRWDTRAVGFARLIYTDAAGIELAQMHPYAMQDLSNRPEVVVLAGSRSLGVSLTIWNTGNADFFAPPAAFALWGLDGMLYRPRDIFASYAPKARVAALRALEHSLDPIPPGSERFGWLHFRLPAKARLGGLLFTPGPERVLVVADLSTPVTAISN